jgi:enamine deaminase RidA (YjgF/YER057c/UK114 family)
MKPERSHRSKTASRWSALSERAGSALLSGVLAVIATVSSTSSLSAAEPVFKLFADDTLPYARGALVESAPPLYFTAGLVPGADAPKDLKGQALVTLNRLKANLATAGFTLSDVVFARAYLAPDAEGKIDYAAWNAAWTEFFAPVAPHKPARSTVGVPLLGRPGTLVEVEFVCAAPATADRFASSDKLGLPVSNPNLKPYGTRQARIYEGVGIQAGATHYWTAGITPPVLKADAPKDSIAYYGDMKTQATGLLKRLQDNLAQVGLTFGDVVFMRAFVGPDNFNGGKFDLENWNAAYAEFFNNPANPHKPARATVTTPTYGSPGMMIEVELLTAFPAEPKAIAFDDAKRPGLKAYGSPTSPIAAGIASRAGNRLFFASAAGPDASAENGDLKTQALSALARLKERLAEAGMSFQDVTFLRADIVPNPDGTLERQGWSDAYATAFNLPAQPYKPARTTIAVHSLPRPQWKIAIDVIAAAP